ncbi:MAG: hypothetical protein ACK6DC_22660 [Planctomycetota bacterium]
MLDAIQYAIRVLLTILLIPLTICSIFVFPLGLFWISRTFICRQFAVSWKINQKLRQRKNFSIFRPRYRRYYAILWSIEGERMTQAFKIFGLISIPPLLAMFIAEILKNMG